MITLGSSFVIPTGAVLSSTLIQGTGLFQGTQVISTMPWREIGLTAGVVIGAWLIRRLGRQIVARTVDNRVVQYRWGKTLAYLTTGLATVFVIGIWVDGLSQVGTFLGLVSAGVAIALKDVLVDIAGWLILITKPPFEVGDRIQIGEHSGDVVDVSALHFHLLEIGNWVDSDQSTGRLIRIPNAKILTDPIANYTSEFPFLWHEVPVVFTFESDWRRAKARLLEMVTEASVEMSQRAAEVLQNRPSRMLISYRTVTATVYTSVLDHGICLSMRFLTDPRRRRAFDQTLWEGVLDIVSSEPNIDLAYPTQRLVGLERESEPSAGTPSRTRRELVEERGIL
jgi:small-conductance mechanosensitive channel